MESHISKLWTLDHGLLTMDQSVCKYANIVRGGPMEGVVGHASSVSGVKDVFSKVSLRPQ